MTDSSWIWYLIAAAYGICWIVTYRVAYRHAMDAEPATDSVDKAMMTTMCMLVGLLGPLALVGYGLYRVATPETAHEKRAAVAALEERRRQLAVDVETLESELYMGQRVAGSLETRRTAKKTAGRRGNGQP